MRNFVLIGALIFLASSAAAQDNNTIQSNALLLPHDSTEFYFKIKNNWKDTLSNAFDNFMNSWYSNMLFHLKEPSLKNYTGGREIYRFTWLRTFDHPCVVRMEKEGSKVVLLSKVSSGAGGYQAKKIIFDTSFTLTQNHIDSINLKLSAAKFWALQTEIDDRGNDGAEWIIEVFKSGKYHVVTRWTPDKGTPFRSIGEYLVSISGIKDETKIGRDY